MIRWLRKRRRDRFSSSPFPDTWTTHLQRNVRHYRYLSASQQRALQRRVQIFVAEKNWLTGGSLRHITQEMKVTVAGTASLLTLGFEDYCYDGLQTIILHPGAYTHSVDDHLIDHHSATLGEAWYRGPIVLSWKHALQTSRSSHHPGNSILHEFAHHLDFLDREIGGDPVFGNLEQSRQWQRVTEAEYLKLVGRSKRGENTLLDPYGATNRAEFFAVATECFFESPTAMRSQHPELYAVLREFYQQDSASWLPDASAEDSADSPRFRSSTHRKLPPRDVDSMSGDDAFSWGVQQLNAGEYQHAVECFSRTIACDPDDAEAYQHRAVAYLRLRRFDEALLDSDQALEKDADDVDACRVRGGALVGLKRFDEALRELDYVVRNSRHDAEGFYLRGLTLAKLAKYRPAIRDFTHALAVAPYDAEVLFWRGRVHQLLGHRSKAERDLSRAYQLDPDIEQRNSSE